jgi:hypothetical protein
MEMEFCLSDMNEVEVICLQVVRQSGHVFEKLLQKDVLALLKSSANSEESSTGGNKNLLFD